MPKAIEQHRRLTVGHFGLGLRGGVAGSVRQEVHDGDTIHVRALGNLGIRFLGIDAPEISFTLPLLPTSSSGRPSARARTEPRFMGLSDHVWEEFLSDPFDESKYGPFDEPLTPQLTEHLWERVGSDAAGNHYKHAEAAQDALEQEVLDDLKRLGQSEDAFQFFLIFAYEVMDRYGRLLCFVNCSEPKRELRPPTYNERLLKAGVVVPYFIWPNLNPFRKEGSVEKAVYDSPAAFRRKLNEDKTLTRAGELIRAARKKRTGTFDTHNPLKLFPFELRFLARRQAPDRWVIDLSKDDDRLIAPQKYYTIEHMEDRLFIPAEYVPLFVEKGWKRHS